MMMDIQGAAATRCGLTLGAWRRTLCVGFAAHVCVLGLVGVTFFEARNVSASGIGGRFCLAGMKCVGVDVDIPSSLGGVSCSVSRPPGNSHLQNGSSCLDTYTMLCLHENRCLGAYTLVSSILNKVELKHVDASAENAYFFPGLGVLFIYSISVALWEFPLSREAYAFNSTRVPERIFLQPFLVGLSLILKVLVLTLLWMLIESSQSFPTGVSCSDVNLLPSIDDVREHMPSRTHFLAKCETMVSECRVSIVGIQLPSLNTKKTAETITKLTRLYAASAVLLFVVFVHKWCVWSYCVAQTVDDEGATQYLQAREEQAAEEFELAIRRIQERRREKRELRLAQAREMREEHHLWDTRRQIKSDQGVQAASLQVDDGVNEGDMAKEGNCDSHDIHGLSLYAVPDTIVKVSEAEDAILEDSNDYIICLDELTLGEGVEALACGHVFHSDCINQWFEEGGQGRLCPLCRHPS